MAVGIPAISFRQGDHICLFYREPQEQMDVAAPFVEIGLLRGERCLCVLNPDQTEYLCESLARRGMDASHEISRGALVLATPQEAYLRGGKFDREEMVKLLDDGMREALALGFTGFRGTGDLSWAAHDTHACGRIPEYEEALDRYYPGKAALGICMYDQRLFTPAQREALQRAHRLSILNSSDDKRSVRIRKGRIFGDVVFDRNVDSPLFHFVVQRENSADVLLSGQESTLTGAIGAVENALRTVV
jgi:hypothetical protein